MLILNKPSRFETKSSSFDMCVTYDFVKSLVYIALIIVPPFITYKIIKMFRRGGCAEATLTFEGMDVSLVSDGRKTTLRLSKGVELCR
jgi:hypothetical protein